MAVIKTVSEKGRISLGKKFAGQNVVVDEIQEGVWIIKVGKFIPDDERWLLSPGVREDLDEAIAWAKNNPPAETNIEELEDKINR